MNNSFASCRCILGGMDKVRQPFSDCCEIEESGERQRDFVVTGGNAALMLEVAEHPLDAVAVTIAAEVTGNVLAPVGLGWDDRQDAVRQQVHSNRVTIIALVCQQHLGLGDRERH